MYRVDGSVATYLTGDTYEQEQSMNPSARLCVYTMGGIGPHEGLWGLPFCRLADAPHGGVSVPHITWDNAWHGCRASGSTQAPPRADKFRFVSLAGEHQRETDRIE